VKARFVCVATALTALTACGSGSDADSREEALKSHLGALRGARVSCEKKECSVVADSSLTSVYSATLVATPIVERALGDPDLDDVETISVTLDDAGRQQVFSLRCDTQKLRPPVTVDTVRQVCHSIFT
jgi:hypothetical protein